MQLLDLPNDILNEISKYISSQNISDYNSFILTCKKFHLLCTERDGKWFYERLLIDISKKIPIKLTEKEIKSLHLKYNRLSPMEIRLSGHKYEDTILIDNQTIKKLLNKNPVKWESFKGFEEFTLFECIGGRPWHSNFLYLIPKSKIDNSFKTKYQQILL